MAPMLVLVLLFFLFLLVFLVLLWSDAVARLHLTKSERVGHECLVGGLLLLLDREERVLADLGGDVARRVRLLRRDEVLVRRADLPVQRQRRRGESGRRDGRTFSFSEPMSSWSTRFLPSR